MYGPAPVGVKSILKVVDPPAGTVVIPNVAFNANSESPTIEIGPVKVKFDVPGLSIVKVIVVGPPIGCQKIFQQKATVLPFLT